MKKNLLLLPFAALLLVGCKTSADVQINTKKETVQLTMANFSNYVAINSSSTYNSNKGSWIFYTHFIGADGYIFIDCKVSYYYKWSMGSQEILDGSTGVANLSLSGDGEAAPYLYTTTNGVAVFTISSVSGTIEISK